MTLDDFEVAVIGLGYVGLPLASLCAKQGHRVIGFDSDQDKIEVLSQGRTPIKDDKVARLFTEACESGNFQVSSKVEDITAAEIYLICVPTPVDADSKPDLEPLVAACRLVAPRLSAGNLVVVESTVFPGTCEEIVAPLLETESGLTLDSEYYLAHCPERVNPGDLFWTSENIPRVVGATSEQGAQLAAEFYASILGGPIFEVREFRQSLSPKFSLTEKGVRVAQAPLGSVTKMRSIRDAEAVKVMENTVRDVNIAFVNELAKISDVLDLDVVDIIDGMATKPFGKGPFFPGVGVGGHCIAVDPEWLKSASEQAGYIPEIIKLARQTNKGMPEYTISLLEDLLAQRGLALPELSIAILGVAYKRNVEDTRESPFYDLRDLLLAKGATVEVFDSWVTEENTTDSLIACLERASVIVVVTEHSDLVDALKSIDLSALGIEVLFDGRNCLDADQVRQQGVLYRGIGRGY